MKTLQIEITSDFICPWCWIGHLNLKRGINLAGLRADAAQLRFLPFELNPGMPVEGVDRRDYRTRKFGSWARSRAMDAEVTLAGQSAGAEFHFDRVRVTPNTRRAHRLMSWAQSHPDAGNLAELPEAIFSAYFSQGKDIGSIAVLVEIAASVGYDEDATWALLAGGAGEREVVENLEIARQDGLGSVPSFSLAGRMRISGARAPEILGQALLTVMEA